MVVPFPCGLVRYQQKYQQTARIPTNRRAPLRTGRREKCLQLLDYLAFSEQTRTTANGDVVPITGIEQAVDVASQQESVPRLVFTAVAIGTNMRSF